MAVNKACKKMLKDSHLLSLYILANYVFNFGNVLEILLWSYIFTSGEFLSSVLFFTD
jgi:hypothetical protein